MNNVALHHQLKIARQTLKMTDAGAQIMGGMSKVEARVLLKLPPLLEIENLQDDFQLPAPVYIHFCKTVSP